MSSIDSSLINGSFKEQLDAPDYLDDLLNKAIEIEKRIKAPEKIISDFIENVNSFVTCSTKQVNKLSKPLQHLDIARKLQEIDKRTQGLELEVSSKVFEATNDIGIRIENLLEELSSVHEKSGIKISLETFNDSDFPKSIASMEKEIEKHVQLPEKIDLSKGTEENQAKLKLVVNQ